ncbi:23S rRNA (uracil(1939)-C(5))-methyltransferase RlmD [Shewanella sp. NKUCC05_KAH]|jgi:23S rRNA (uracil1939-C5)-methyltransferase|uniref:23S rRNA (uracil(1939)-C(5))-methyltransferase RlmD n=1 Tax=unclassified Shewanella TaxID=196818 RepID=UPI00048ADDC2|nr:MULTISPECIES: 23S rRNA (uracil(1939)-C(5))-methyltransferase RlmD [unclassified Shewanella]MBW3527071.1 23S rRNA (uracil(1939)-C(5))-methyltransferase RlmD [Shewanella sp. NKUCC05_KAH]MCU7963665.1 23S rRNA (uracil(1939)-C(5))-methyltransferase RlmD [Shewanella sp. SW32]MCU7971580.1 23S rRNA (uracil(1939)-C(5))-methyltransferase RlmD [Shewanella sp. SW29]MCU8001712.1 23S rRNA (uracil(1939)-C(5))-methyltransferase RlmD [Shewanella sp. SM96]MCU8060141.1 23S rRNA (uracil(1939)-C(5))-methyltrans
MAQFFKAKPNSSKQLSAKLSLSVEQLDHLGAGIAQHQGKVVFIPGALPDETVTVQLTEQKKNYARAKLIKVDSSSPERVEPECPHYHTCGGCDLQHMSLSGQREHKEAALLDIMAKFAGTEGGALSPALTGEGWHYRRRARLATLFDKNTKHLSLGFRAASSSNVVPISQCLVLAKPLSDLIVPFAKLLNQLSAKASLGHLELIAADNGHFAVLRITKALNDKDLAKLSVFAELHQIHICLQDNEGQFQGVGAELVLPVYQLLDENAQSDAVSLSFTPGNFVQVNGQINKAMVAQAMDWLAPAPDERILDLFCGMGNFSLPLAKMGADVIGVEGVAEMVTQARVNAKANNLDKLTFYHGDLSADLSLEPWMGKIDKLLLDPARAGAFESLQWLKKMKPRKVVYVSCNPASLARDSAVLLERGYRLQQLGLIDMFPQTHHIEAMALFELTK